MKRREDQRQKHRDHNRHLLDAVLERIPKTLTRADYELLVIATIERLQYEDWDAICDRYFINTDEMREPDAAAFELGKKAKEATEPQLVRMLMELALLPSGYSDEPLEPTDPLASAARRLGVSLTAKNGKPPASKCGSKAKRPQASARPKTKVKATTKIAKRGTAKGGAA